MGRCCNKIFLALQYSFRWSKRLFQQITGQHDKDVYKRQDIYYAAYQHLYSNKGAGTKGVTDDTADGFSEIYIENIIERKGDTRRPHREEKAAAAPEADGQHDARQQSEPEFHKEWFL